MPSHCSYNKCPWLIKTHCSVVPASLSNNLSPHILPLSLATFWSLEFLGSLSGQSFLLLLSYFAPYFLSLKTPSLTSCLTLYLTTYSSALRYYLISSSSQNPSLNTKMTLNVSLLCFLDVIYLPLCYLLSNSIAIVFL